MRNTLKRGDIVVVIAGNDKGKSGEILEVLRKKNRVVVGGGIGVVKRHVPKSQNYPNGAVLEKPMSIHRSNVALKKRAEGPAKRGDKNA
jgi:large subunit ribosomal protein L24